MSRKADIFDAIGIAVEAHRGQTDLAGKPYILHPMAVAEAVSRHGEAVMMAAVLHDVLEDSAVGEDGLRSSGIPEEVVEAVVALTRRKGEAYREYVLRAARNPIARTVKEADASHNLRRCLEAAGSGDGERFSRLAKRYEEALSVLRVSGPSAKIPS